MCLFGCLYFFGIFFVGLFILFFFFIKYNIFYLKKRDNSSKKVDLQLNYAKTGPFKKYLLSIVIRICKVKIEKISAWSLFCYRFFLIFFYFFIW